MQTVTTAGPKTKKNPPSTEAASKPASLADRPLPKCSCCSTPYDLTSIVEGAVVETGLTDREAEVLRLIVKGLEIPEVGETLEMAPKTVKDHLSSIHRKFGVASRVELMADLFPT